MFFDNLFFKTNFQGNGMTCIRFLNLQHIKSRISWLSRTSWHPDRQIQVHGATPTTDMSWLWQCLQIWDRSRITAASCTSVFVLFLYKDLSKGKTSLGGKKKEVAPTSCFCLWVTVSNIYSALVYWKYVTIAYQLQEIRPLTRQSTFLPVTPLVEINPLKQHLMAAIKHSSVSYVIRIIW